MNLIITGDGTVTGTHVATEDGRDISKSVSAVRFSHEAGKSPAVEVDIILPRVGFPGEGKAFFDGREVRRIIYADGGEEEF